MDVFLSPTFLSLYGGKKKKFSFLCLIVLVLSVLVISSCQYHLSTELSLIILDNPEGGLGEPGARATVGIIKGHIVCGFRCNLPKQNNKKKATQFL